MRVIRPEYDSQRKCQYIELRSDNEGGELVEFLVIPTPNVYKVIVELYLIHSPGLRTRVYMLAKTYPTIKYILLFNQVI